MNLDRPVIFFDGVCNLCNGVVDFLLGVDKKNRFYFASLQGQTAQKLLPKSDLGELLTIIVKDGDQLYYKSSAVFHIAYKLKGIFLLLLIFWPLPRFFTNWIYDLVASNRYRLFGQKETCRIPTDSERKHFLD